MQTKCNIHCRKEKKRTQRGSQEVTPCWEGGSGRQHSHHASLPEETLSGAPRGTVWHAQAFPATDPPTEAPLCVTDKRQREVKCEETKRGRGEKRGWKGCRLITFLHCPWLTVHVCLNQWLHANIYCLFLDGDLFTLIFYFVLNKTKHISCKKNSKKKTTKLAECHDK